MAEVEQHNRDSNLTTIRSWMLCFVVCNFNVDKASLRDPNSCIADDVLPNLDRSDVSPGPEIEMIYPPDTAFSSTDLAAICFNSFPERHDGDIQEDIYFSFTLRNNSPSVNLSSASAPYGSSKELHGVSVFRQEYDENSKRSFNQKTLVIISNHDFAVFLMTLLRIVVTDSTIGDIARLEAACAQIMQWKSPAIGVQRLPFMGDIITLDIPLFPSFPLTGHSSPFSATTSLMNNMSATQPTQSWVSLLPLLPSPTSLYIVYECLIVGGPVIVLGHSPQHVSAMCTALLDLIRPIPYAGAVRPYLPMQNTGLASDGNLFDPTSSQSFIAGITNPFLLQRYSLAQAESIPYILALASQESSHHQSKQALKHDWRVAHPSLSRSSRSHRLSGSRSSSSKALDVPGTPMRSQTRPIHHIKHDRSFMNTVSIPDEHGALGSALHIRRHFTDVTARLLAPINRYIATINTAAGSTILETKISESRYSAAQVPPTPSMMIETGTISISMRPKFSLPDFLMYLAKQDSPIIFVGQTSRGRHRARDAFYTKFCSSTNFKAWLQISNVMKG